MRIILDYEQTKKYRYAIDLSQDEFDELLVEMKKDYENYECTPYDNFQDFINGEILNYLKKRKIKLSPTITHVVHSGEPKIYYATFTSNDPWVAMSDFFKIINEKE